MTTPHLLIAAWSDFFTGETALAILRVALTLLIGIPLVYFLSRSSNRLFTKSSAHAGMITSKAIFYIGVTLITFTCLRELGWALTAFLGEAGMVGVATGIASRNSIS